MLTETGADAGGTCPTKVLELALLSIVQLSALDDDSVCWQVDSPGQRGSCAEHLQATQAIPSPTNKMATCTPRQTDVISG